MNVKDLVTLTRAGYSKKEIEELSKEDNGGTDLQTSVDELKKVLDDTIKTINKSAVSETVTTKKDDINEQLTDVQNALKTLMLGGTADGGTGENKEEKA